MTLRAYQEEAVKRCVEALRRDARTLLVMPTGTGKTEVFLEVARRMRNDGLVLLLAHRRELLEQAIDRQYKHRNSFYAAYEIAERRGSGQLTAEMVAATVQTLYRPARLKTYSPHRVHLIIIDEAHHAVASTYQKILKHFPSAKVLGVTATPHRHDKRALSGVFRSVAYQYEARRAIQDGWLVPVDQQIVKVTHIDLTHVKCRSGDFQPESLSDVMVQEKALHSVVVPSLKMVSTPDGHLGKTLVFGASVAHSDALASVFNHYRANSAASLCGATCPTRRQIILQDFRSGVCPILCNYNIATEGFDVPDIAAIVLARPTRSTLLYTQQIGRGLRPISGLVDQFPTAAARRAVIKSSSKPRLLVLDFVGTSRHKLIHAAEALSGVETRVTEVANTIAEVSEGPTDVVSSLEQAQLLVNMMDQATRSGLRLKDIQWKLRATSPFVLFDIPPELDIRQIVVKPAGARQRRRLEQLGIKTAGLGQVEAGRILGALEKRRAQGLCTYKQLKILGPRGFPASLSFENANRVIDDLAKHGWQWTRFRPFHFQAANRTG